MSTLCEIYSDCFATVFAFRAAPNNERPAYDAFRHDVTTLLAKANREAEAANLDPRQYAFYAIVALIDETVNKSDWPGAGQWRKETLQMMYFQNLLAAENFFRRLDELHAGADTDLLEIYFTCLCAGFEGMYRSDPATLAARRRKLHQQLDTENVRNSPHLTEEAYDRKLERELLRSHFPVWWLGAIVLAVLGLYLALYSALWQQTGQIIERAS